MTAERPEEGDETDTSTSLSHGRRCVNFLSTRKSVDPHRYLVCQTAQKRGAAACAGSRVPVRELEAFVVDKLKCIGRDPKVIEDTVTAARDGLQAKRPEIERNLIRLEKERVKLDSERQNLVDSIATAKDKSPSILQRVGELDVAVQAIDGHVHQLREELEALEGQTIDEADLRKALGVFDGLWSNLFPQEQARVVHLLIERIVYDAVGSEISITFRANGVKCSSARNSEMMGGRQE